MNKGIVLVQIAGCKKEYELEIPLDIEVKTICIYILKALNLETKKGISGFYIKSENPTCFLKGNDILSYYGISSGSKLYII